ncbi:MAG: HAMP domain-containing histidine kinase [Bernardetiaceae bacterium]|jgi:two-component system phosphate regulon sensor histidine kinase PhoR|nr:HAMP domain-containing histidine kinase [Bernardetiaceae bacterium]
MRRNAIRWLVVLATVAIVGIVTVQVYWVSQAANLEAKRSDQAIYVALQRVAQQIAAYNQSVLPVQGVVNQVSSDYFIVNVNTVIDVSVLEHYLRREFGGQGIQLDFEYGIYDCGTDKMVYGNYVTASGQQAKTGPARELPKYDKLIYYFGVQFPDKDRHLVANLGVWGFLSVIILVVIGFFAYALFVILRQKRLAEVQKDFVDNMTHEFQTPIATISIAADVLAKPETAQQPERLRNYAAIVRNESQRLKEQVERVLQMSRIEKRQLELNRQPLSLHELLQEAAQSFALTWKNGQPGQLHTQLAATQFQVKADKVHLTNLIFNLLDNAAKYSPGAPEITLATHNQGPYVWLTVQDRGLGIDKKYQGKIFDKFFRVPTGNLHSIKGFGLGLHYVRSVVRAHGWRLQVHSEPGQGTRFQIKMPVG